MVGAVIGLPVQYLANTIRGCYAAVITAVFDDGSVNLRVFGPTGNTFPAFQVTREPSSKVGHYWRPISTGTQVALKSEG